MERGNSLVGFTVVIAVIALFLGLALANADIMNPYRGPAQARVIEQEAEIQAAREWQALEIERQEAQIRLEGERQQQEVKLALMKWAGTVLAVAGAVAIMMLAYGATAWMVARARQITAASLPAPPAHRAISPDRSVRYARPTDAPRSVYRAAPESGGDGKHSAPSPKPTI